MTYESDYDAVLTVKARRDRLDDAIAQMAANSEFTPLVRRLSCLRGVSNLTALALAVEIGDWHRFTGNTIGSFVGLVPSEYSHAVRSGPEATAVAPPRVGARRVLSCHGRAQRGSGWPRRPVRDLVAAACVGRIGRDCHAMWPVWTTWAAMSRSFWFSVCESRRSTPNAAAASRP
jgi:transposase